MSERCYECGLSPEAHHNAGVTHRWQPAPMPPRSIRDRRLDAELSLRETAKRARIGVVRLGEIERGVGEPATDDETRRLDEALRAANPEGRRHPPTRRLDEVVGARVRERERG